VASEAETLSLPPDPAQRATEILARPERTRSRRFGQRWVAIAVLVTAAAAGLVAAIALSSGGGPASPGPGSKPRAVPPPPAGTSVADQARNLVVWLRQHQG
jgi:ferric-dicitrate binding protein FerR (iron transport regulator)